jgi:hypothetical protein
MRALAALRMVWASARFGCLGLDGGGDVGDVVCEEAAGGCAALAVSRVVGGAGEARLASEEAKDGVNMCEPVFFLTKSKDEKPCQLRDTQSYAAVNST